jgi:hypothetical protein
LTYTLYYSPGAASMAVHWMLIELGIEFDAKLVNIDAGEQRAPEYLRMNPAGRTTWRNLAPYIHRMRALPSFIEVNEREGLTDWRN